MQCWNTPWSFSCVSPSLTTLNTSPWHFWSPHVWGLFRVPSNSPWYQLSVLQFNLTLTASAGGGVRSLRLRSRSPKTAPALFRCQLQGADPQGTQHFCLTWPPTRVPMMPSSDSINSRAARWEPRTFTNLKDILKDTGEQPDEDAWEGPEHRSSCPGGGGLPYTEPPPGRMCSATCKPLNPPILGFLWRRHHAGLTHHSLHFQPFSLLKRMWG